MKCITCKLFDLYWDADNETKDNCDQRRKPANCSRWLCNDPKSGCPLLARNKFNWRCLLLPFLYLSMLIGHFVFRTLGELVLALAFLLMLSRHSAAYHFKNAFDFNSYEVHDLRDL